MLDTGQHVEQPPLGRARMPGAVRCHDRQPAPARNFDDGLVARLLVAAEMALQFGIHVPAPIDAEEPLHTFHSGFKSLAQGKRQRPAGASGQADESPGKRRQVFIGCCAFPLLRPQFHLRDEAAQVPIPALTFDEQRQAAPLNGRDFGAEVRLDSGLSGRQVKPRRAVDTVPIQESQRRHLELRGARRQGLGERRAFEKTERRVSMKLDEHQS